MLESLGFHVDQAADPAAALKRSDRGLTKSSDAAPRLLLVDMCVNQSLDAELLSTT